MPTSLLFADPARAWKPYVPRPDAPWDLGKVAHLHRRAGFSTSWATLQRDLKDGPGPSIDRLLNGEPTSLDGKPAVEFDAFAYMMALQLAPGSALTRLQALWFYRLIFTGHPLRERMTLFWHNHFATSETKVNNPTLMQRQNELLREHALGDFKSLLTAIGKDPAMLIWLDSTANRKAHPNENYAREVMELFTLGRGHYTEKDVQEAARAFTGRFVVRDRFSNVPSQHDAGVKTVLYRTGNLGGDDIPEILLAQPSCAEFLCGKLVRQFVTEVDPVPPELIKPLAHAFRDSSYDIRVPVAMILRSNLFFDPAMRRKRVKSPVEFAVGTIRALEVVKPTVQADALAESCARMGQSLYAPPSVAGWDGGESWVNSTAMLSRTNLALGLLGTEAAFGNRLDPDALAARHGISGKKEVSRFYVDLLARDALASKVREKVEAATSAREAVTLILSAPEYQLA